MSDFFNVNYTNIGCYTNDSKMNMDLLTKNVFVNLYLNQSTNWYFMPEFIYTIKNIHTFQTQSLEREGNEGINLFLKYQENLNKANNFTIHGHRYDGKIYKLIYKLRFICAQVWWKYLQIDL